MKIESSKRIVAVLGAGPVGLAAAAHLLERNLQPVVLEARPTIAGSLQDVRHVKLFSPWRYNMDHAALRRGLESRMLPGESAKPRRTRKLRPSPFAPS